MQLLATIQEGHKLLAHRAARFPTAGAATGYRSVTTRSTRKFIPEHYVPLYTT
jgi:hypothetical protein